MSEDIHSLQGALAMALITIGSAFTLLGLAEWIEYRTFKKQRKENRDRNFDIEN